ncbi:terpene synthase family protein [Cystobacter ferrugineus]|uniref:Terpene synthase n=1 Tax=Cystobacter ferrugineus TaxID=83449 RepID=A0A1L9BC78_9BACT|nr:hypothetical protein [Cystobacter ferrugineus]OJH39823.1 hypothetical protein BON30_12045 [Cystobacter ferrugineus]
MRTIPLPPLSLPFPQKLNPHNLQAWPHTVEWVKRFHLLPEKVIPHFRTLDYHWLSAYAFPEANLEQLILINDCMTAFYLFDKHWDDAPPEALESMQASLLAALWGRPPGDTPEGPLENAMRDMRRRMMKFSTDAWMTRFCESLEAYFKACVWEAKNKSNHQVPDVATYIREREATGAVQPSFELAGVLGLVQIPPSVLEEPTIKRLNQLANHEITLFNDLISLEKEMRVGDMHNLVFIIQNEQKCSLEEAMRQAAKMHDDEVLEFLELETRLPTWGEPLDTEVRRYVDVLRCWMRANMDWSLMSERYKAPAA